MAPSPTLRMLLVLPVLALAGSPQISWFRRATPSPPAPEATPVPEPAEEDPAKLYEALRGELDEFRRSVNRAGGCLPDGAVPGFMESYDILRPLLAFAGKKPPRMEHQITIEGLIREHLPTSLETFLALPKSYVETGRTRMGRTPSEELLEQIHLLRDAAKELSVSVYEDASNPLSVQTRFLDAKFRRSDLDL